MKLKIDIISVVDPKVVYGHQGDEVQLVNDHGNVLIVEYENGKRISVNSTDVTELQVEIKKEIITVPDATVQNKINREPVSRKKAVSLNQKSLF